MGRTGNIATVELFDNVRSSHLPVGRYTVAGRSSQFEGDARESQAPRSVTVTNDVTSRVKMACQER
jgi:hypothetical protein